jgi:hypothetical protein
MTQFTVKVRQLSLGPGQSANGEIAQVGEPLGEQAQGGAFAGARVAHGQGEATFANLLFDPPAKAFDGGRDPEGRSGQFGGNGVELEAIEAEELYILDGFWVWGLGR